MKKINISILVIFMAFAGRLTAQKAMDDYDRIAITPYVSDRIASMPPSAAHNLEAKLTQIIASNGLGASDISTSSRFIITPNVVISNKHIVPGAPPRVAVTLDVVFYVGDGISGTKFGSTTVTAKGVGSNENKAYISAFNQIRANNSSIQKLIDRSKQKILEYYDDGCVYILKDAEVAAAQNKYDLALALLGNIPRINRDCYDKAMKAIIPIYQKKINRDCQILLNQARNVWNTGQDYNAAVKAMNFLQRVQPEAVCYKEATELSNEMGTRVRQLDDRVWDLTLRVQQDDIDLQKQAIEAARDVGVARGNNQPSSVVYNVRDWW